MAYSQRPGVRRLVWLLVLVVLFVASGHLFLGRQEDNQDHDNNVTNKSNDDPLSTEPPLPEMTTIDESAGLDRHTVIRQMLLQLGINSPEQLDTPD